MPGGGRKLDRRGRRGRRRRRPRRPARSTASSSVSVAGGGLVVRARSAPRTVVGARRTRQRASARVDGGGQREERRRRGRRRAVPRSGRRETARCGRSRLGSPRPTRARGRRRSANASSAAIIQSACAVPGGVTFWPTRADPALEVGRGAVLLGEAGGRQDHVGAGGRLGEEHVDGDDGARRRRAPARPGRGRGSRRAGRRRAAPACRCLPSAAASRMPGRRGPGCREARSPRRPARGERRRGRRRA